MKWILWTLLCLLPLTASARPQGDQGVVAQAESVSAQRMAQLSPGLQDWVRQEIARRGAAGPVVNEPSLRSAAANRLAGQKFSTADVDALVNLVMMMATKDAENDLRNQLRQTRANLAQKRAQRERAEADQEDAGKVTPAGKDSLSGMSEQQQLQLQMMMDRRQKLLETLSNLLKKAAETEQTITQNLK